MHRGKIEQALQGYGLSEKGVRVYLALLELGVASGKEVSEKSKIIRTTTYSVLDDLKRVGLVTEVQKGKVRHYTVEDPKKIITKMEKRTELIKDVAPDLVSLYGLAEHRPLVRFYKGLSGIKEVYEMILKERGLKEYDIISAESTWLKMDQKYFGDFLQRRAEKNIKTRLVVDSAAKGLSHQTKNEKLKRKVKFLPKKFQGAFTSGIYILPTKVIFIAQKQELVAVVVESREIVEAQRFMFNFFWSKLD